MTLTALSHKLWLEWYDRSKLSPDLVVSGYTLTTMEQRLLRSAGKLWHDLDGVDAAERKHMLSELVGIIYILRYNSYTGHAYTTKERSPENADGQRHGHRHIHTAMVRPREEHVCGESIAHLDD